MSTEISVNLDNDTATIDGETVGLNEWLEDESSQVIAIDTTDGRTLRRSDDGTWTVEAITVNHVTGYHADGEANVETRTVTVAELCDWLGDTARAHDLLTAGRLGEHDEWMVQA